VGRAYPGLYGIACSYEEAREALTMAIRLHLDSPVVNAHELLVYRVLLCDQPAIVDLVSSCSARYCWPGAAPSHCWPPLDAYFGTGAVATESPNACTCPCAPSPTGWPA
jgi:hypothetical protein